MIIHRVSYISVRLHQRSITTAPTLFYFDRFNLFISSTPNYNRGHVEAWVRRGEVTAVRRSVLLGPGVTRWRVLRLVRGRGAASLLLLLVSAVAANN